MRKLIYIPAVILLLMAIVDIILSFDAMLNNDLGNSAFWLMAAFSSGMIGAILWVVASYEEEK